MNQTRITSASLSHEDIVGFGQMVFKFASASITPLPRPVANSHASVTLICQGGMEEGYEIRIEGQTADIGRDKSNQVRLLHNTISRRHCRLAINGLRVIAKLSTGQ